MTAPDYATSCADPLSDLILRSARWRASRRMLAGACMHPSRRIASGCSSASEPPRQESSPG